MANRKTKPDHQTDKADLTNQIARERGGTVVGLGATRSPNTYEVQKWNGVPQWAQKHSKSASSLEAGALSTSGWAQGQEDWTKPVQIRQGQTRARSHHARPDRTRLTKDKSDRPQMRTLEKRKT